MRFPFPRSRSPGISAWMECCYGAQPTLHLGDNTILSKCGVQQGDPLGPLGFALTLHPVIERIHQEVPGLRINAWYLDDGTLVGSPSDLKAALQIIETEGPDRGLHLNRSKSLLFIPAGSDSSLNQLPSDIPITREGFVLLGSPIWSPTFCEAAVGKRVAKVRETLPRLPDLEDSQMETTLLRSCLALPKISFSLRTCPPGHIQEATVAFDDVMREALSDLAGGPLPEWAWLKASLPSSLGGLNIRRASQHAPEMASKILGHALEAPLAMGNSISMLAEATARPDWVSLEEIDVPLRQRPLSHSIDEACFHRAGGGWVVIEFSLVLQASETRFSYVHRCHVVTPVTFVLRLIILAFPPIILVLCSMLPLTYCSQNYASIFCPGLQLHVVLPLALNGAS